jgi:hypothetical protein
MIISTWLRKLHPSDSGCGRACPSRISTVRSAGHTLVELTLAISLAGMLVGIVAVSYVTVYRGFAKHTIRVSNVQEMIRVKGEIRGILRRNDVLVSCTSSRILCRSDGDTTTHTLEFTNRLLKYDREILSRTASAFSTDLSEKPTAEGRYLLQWDVQFGKDRWIGGAEFVKTAAAR